ncbi:MAG: hypothetical protein ACRDD2_02975 [Sarcina sp.]
MNIKGKRLFVNLNFFSPKGNLLDISNDNSGIIYNLTKHNIQTVDIDEIKLEKDLKYQSCAIFFVCSLLGKVELNMLFNDIENMLDDNSEIYIWDRIKNIGEIINDEIFALLPNQETKKFKYINLNPFSQFNLENLEKTLEKSFEITETIIWDKIIYFKAKKKGTNKDENTFSRDKLEIYT